MGAVYSGEDFRAAISITSVLDPPPTSVSVKLELQAGTRRWPLVDTTDPPLPFPSEGHTSYVVSYPLTDVGLHCLVASIAYSYGGAPLTYAKFFKFNVLPPFHATTQVHSREDLLWVEVALTNAMQRAVQLTALDVVGGDTDGEQWTVQRVGGDTAEEGRLGPLPVNTTRVFIFRLEREGGVEGGRGPEGGKAGGDIGRVTVSWRGYMGEKCHLPGVCVISRTQRMTSQGAAAVPSPAPHTPPLSLQLLSCPASAVLERPFTVRVAVSNPHHFPLHRVMLSLMREKMGGVLAMGKSRVMVGKIEPRGRVEVEVRLMGIGLGLQKIGGFRVVAAPQQGSGEGGGGDVGWRSQHVMQMDFDGLHHMEILAE